MFDTGEICPTKLATSRAKGLGIDLMMLLMKHTEGDWSELTPTEIKLNAAAIENGRNIYSRYRFGTNVFLLATNQKENYTSIEMADEDE